ncbi:hypothetical protein BAUCODRAFT_274890 [Baudoinia panamericana UAMH 10762]|uniref:Uncharacterized protein n=1 Tax=Baudoinia panamericana (strain UAMH 10762) TaxID=717646 RepID=M2M701_BAUPA|nr:uncharacterized protein BAUCODRAFT_274890 [Baudoinia panamericana UAMH 10762]EMC92056.1 hypothetical protein BAUCODRAFT_274890 [Baudoinia panamericana UAMH 10762]
MSIIFMLKRANSGNPEAKGRLCVGYRSRDWTPVWYEPIIATGEDGEDIVQADNTAEVALFTGSTDTGAGDEFRGPMLGEVQWLPHYDPAKCESKSAKEREDMQKQFLYDCHMYLRETDGERVREMETETAPRGLKNEQWPKWRSWFEEAKKWKRKMMARRAATRRVREKRARAGKGELEYDSELSEDDSAYETEGEAERSRDQVEMAKAERSRARREGKGRKGNMGPPAKPTSRIYGKRKAAAKPSGRAKPAAKKSRSTARGFSQGSSQYADSTDDLLMSGGLQGGDVPILLGMSNGSTASEAEDEDDDEDERMTVERSDFIDHHSTRPSTPATEQPQQANKSQSIGLGGLPALGSDEALRDISRITQDRRNERLRHFEEWIQGAERPYPTGRESVQPRASSIMSYDDAARAQRAVSVNGEIDEEEALRRVLEWSTREGEAAVVANDENREEGSQGGDGDVEAEG